MSKRYYWLKLKDDFFSSIKIKKLRKTEDGNLLTIIYLKMQLLSVKTAVPCPLKGWKAASRKNWRWYWMRKLMLSVRRSSS